MSFIDELQGTIERVAAQASRRGRHRGAAAGSGIVVGDGRVLTNAHNIRASRSRSTSPAIAPSAARWPASMLTATSPSSSVDTAGAPAFTWGNVDGLSTASSSSVPPLASGGTRVTFGTVSAVARVFRGPGGRRITGSIEHTAPLPPGSSGGPILDAEGRLLGLNTNRLGEGFYLAIPADAALRERVEALGRGESPQHPKLGIAAAPSEVARRLRSSVGLPDRSGLLVRAVEDGSRRSGGDHHGDLIVEIAGQAVEMPTTCSTPSRRRPRLRGPHRPRSRRATLTAAARPPPRATRSRAARSAKRSRIERGRAVVADEAEALELRV